MFETNIYIFDLIFQTIYSVRSNNLRLKYLRFTPSGGENMGIRDHFEFSGKSQILDRYLKLFLMKEFPECLLIKRCIILRKSRYCKKQKTLDLDFIYDWK